MIIDVHSHLPTHRGPVPPEEFRSDTITRPDRPVVSTQSWDDYLKAIEPVDRAIVFGIKQKGPPEPDGLQGIGIRYRESINDHVADLARSHPGKIIGFMSVHPEDSDCLDEVERCVHDLGLKGIKLGAAYQFFDPLDTPAFRLYERAQQLGLPIVFHQGTVNVRMAHLKYTMPLLMDEIAIAFPELRIVMAHMGHPWQKDTCTVIRKHPYVYADVSGLVYRPWSFYKGMAAALEWNVLDKLLFASDFPITTPQETMDGLRNVNRIIEGTPLPRIPAEKLEAIIQRDSLSLLGISLPEKVA